MDDIDWQSIRPWNGTQHGGFEELCIQLARAETPKRARFIPLGAPDAGVECYCVLGDNSEWGWQAKYFISTLTNTQWKQVDDSVEKALKKHHDLARYFICVPRDRPDPRKPDQKWEMDRWNDHVSKWQGWAQDRSMNVEFVWWGSSELLERLSQNEHIGRRFFWFGQRGFDQDWFRQHLEEAVAAAGPRYTPEVHIDLPIVKDMERFSKSSFLFEEVKSLAIGIRRTYASLMSARNSLVQPIEGPDIDDLSGGIRVLLDSLSQIEISPIVPLPSTDIVEAAKKADEASDRVADQVRQMQRTLQTASQESRTSRTHYRDPVEHLLYYLHLLQGELRDVTETCTHCGALANGRLMLLKGSAGTGKTHLLCDFAKKRIEAQLPTVILMGQRFLSKDDPWTQLLNQLDLSGSSAEDFVGALEAAAQASDCRALVLIDALNEGNGKEIWRAHLSSFLSRLEESPWIGVVLSVRSSYEEVVIPGNVREKAEVVTHYGFGGQEYDAAQSFFAHYGLEFPSVPILQPEFRNPLFLKTICRGLSEKGERRIPRGFHGITAVFSLYLETVSDRLAADLDYNPNDNFVRKALDRLSELLVEAESRWLPRPRVEQAVNELLPGRGFSNSLYRGLVTEGVLIEDRGWWSGNPPEEVVFIAYDRFADHIIADFLIRTHLNIADPPTAFANGGGLAFLSDGKAYVYQGLIEALCIQVPERTGQELVRLAPIVKDSPAIGDAFLDSIVWRDLDAFLDDTLPVLDELLERGEIRSDPLDALLTVSTIPEHPLNADFLDRRLRRDNMPDRDAWWSIYLHKTRGSQGPVDRLLDWASSLAPSDDVDERVVDLSATALVWMLTTSNRFLRDRATKALVSLLSGRPESTLRIVDRFANADDPYLLERVYAVAYGTAMRSPDVGDVGKLASLVYEQVFASGAPPPHILLRDYARGVVERALYLGADIHIDQRLIRPPYGSEWPSVPCEDCVEGLFPNLDKGAWDGGDLEWSRNRIHWSVMGDDFARYVVDVANWLSLRIGEETWQSPDQRRQTLVSKLEGEQLQYWNNFTDSESALKYAEGLSLMANIRWLGTSQDKADKAEAVAEAEDSNVDEQQAIEDARQSAQVSLETLTAQLSAEDKAELATILRDEASYGRREGPRFDQAMVQRYILWRVFDLGWTIDRFGHFDRFYIGYSGRDAAKPERIGKKYQWIAYHEVLAYIADHFQYRTRYVVPGDQNYRGPWQESLRNIDPSFTLPSKPSGTSGGSRQPSWWGKESYEAWESGVDHRDWLSHRDDIPSIEQLLMVDDSTNGTRWLNVNGVFVWQQPHPADVDPYDTVRREVWFHCIGYFVNGSDVERFTEWATRGDNSRRHLPGGLDLHGVFIGESGWAPAFEDSSQSGQIELEPIDPSELPMTVRSTCYSYHAGISSFDCSGDDTVNLLVPDHHFASRLGLKWSGAGSDFLDVEGKVGAFDPTAHQSGPSALLLREDLVKEYLREESLALCWVVVGEKWVIGERSNREFHGALKMSGVFRYANHGPEGQLGFQFEAPEER